MYLHDSLVGHHGDVNCHNCLLDNRFVLKLAYFRLDFLPRATPSSQDEENEYKQFVSFAPEQLRAPITHIFRGSKEADVYSFGHTLYHLASEVEPFEEEMNEHNFTPKGKSSFLFRLWLSFLNISEYFIILFLSLFYTG